MNIDNIVIPSDDENLAEYLANVERERIISVLEAVKGNVTVAAKLLGLYSAVVLYRKIERLDIDIHDYRVVEMKRHCEPMHSLYIPINKSCPKCDPIDEDGGCFGFPELNQSSGIRWWCWKCDSYFVRGSDGKFRKIIEGAIKKSDPDVKDPSNPGQHKGKKVIGAGAKP